VYGSDKTKFGSQSDTTNSQLDVKNTLVNNALAKRDRERQKQADTKERKKYTQIMLPKYATTV
jgi:hypothetical protein